MLNGNQMNDVNGLADIILGKQGTATGTIKVEFEEFIQNSKI